jgi:hypothetical protein
MSGISCASPGCTNAVVSRLACPKCMQLGLPPVYFCGQVRNLDGYGTFIIFYFVLFTSLAHGIFCCILTCYSTPPNLYIYIYIYISHVLRKIIINTRPFITWLSKYSDLTMSE